MNSFCPSMHPAVYLHPCLSILGPHLSICLSLCQCVPLCAPSAHLCAPPVHSHAPSVLMSSHACFCPSICPFICPWPCWSFLAPLLTFSVCSLSLPVCLIHSLYPSIFSVLFDPLRVLLSPPVSFCSSHPGLSSVFRFLGLGPSQGLCIDCSLWLVLQEVAWLLPHLLQVLCSSTSLSLNSCLATHSPFSA